jgi:hypothetical protein
VRIFRRRAPLRVLDERECYLRLHGIRSGDVAVVQRIRVPDPPPPPAAEPDGPTEESPALHLLISYPRNRSRLNGEQLRRELLRRMSARTGEAA